MGTTVQDIRLALRLLRRDPLFTTIAVLTLAVGVAATVLVFSIVNAVLLRPLPYPDAGRLATLTDRYANYGDGLTLGPTVPELLEITAGTRTLAGVAWVDYRDHQIRHGAEPARLFSARVSPNFFNVLGAQPLLGRLFSEVDNRPIEQNLIVLSHGLWQRQFGADPAVIGKVITMNAHPAEIIGVLPASFAFDYQTLGIPEPTEIFTVFPMVPDYLLRTGSSANARRVRPVVRLKPDVSPGQVQADLHRVVEQMTRDHPTAYVVGDKHEDPGFRIEMTPLQDAVVASSRVGLVLLLAGVGMLLLIACANIASLLLAKAVARQTELAIRTALGAGRWRLVRQSLTESLVLAALGGTLALLLTAWLLPFITRVGAAYLPRLEEARLDVRVLLFALALSLLSALLFGVAPSLHTRTRSLMTQLMQARRGAAGAAGRTRVRDALVVAQIALSVMLSIGAGLLTRSLLSLQQLPPGFSPEHVLTLQLRLQYYAYAGQTQASTRYEQILRRLEGLPGVDSVAMTTALPTRGGGLSDIAIAGRPTDMRTVARQMAWTSIVSPAFFRTLRIPLLDGRVFTQADDRGAPVVAVINETMARLYWPGESPVGRELLFGPQHVPIVGVVGDTRASGLGRTPVPQIYRSYLQAFEPNMRLVARTTADPAAMMRTIEQAVWSIDPDQMLFNAATLDDVLREAVAEPRQRMVVSTLVAGVALAMALTGLFGLVSYRVVQRTAELGVRIALGAQPHQVLTLVLRHTLGLVVIGLASGVIGALLVSRALASVMHDLLYGASARDVTTYAAVSAAFVLTALLASALPARRAVRIDPAVALRNE